MKVETTSSSFSILLFSAQHTFLKSSWVWWHVPVITATQVVEMGDSWFEANSDKKHNTLSP
jgi:hypothetical protein